MLGFDRLTNREKERERKRGSRRKKTFKTDKATRIRCRILGDFIGLAREDGREEGREDGREDGRDAWRRNRRHPRGIYLLNIGGEFSFPSGSQSSPLDGRSGIIDIKGRYPSGAYLTVSRRED